MVDSKPNPGRLFPVCLATDVPAKFKDRFIQENQDNGDQMDCFLVFIDDLEAVYTESSEIGFEEAGSGVGTSPFEDKSIHECRSLLVQLRSAGSDLDYDRFAIIDKRSLQDNTVMLAVGELSESDHIDTIRAVLSETSSRLSLYLVGIADIREDQEVAAQNDGVYSR